MIKLTKRQCPNPRALHNNYKHKDIKEAIKQDSFEKCIYCESKISHVYFGDIEHMKPKSKFPELKFNWDNLAYVCAKCNNAKSDKWDENFPFINPYIEDPSSFLVAAGSFIYHFSGNKRGELTEKEIKLNRPELVEMRKERLDAIRTLADRYAIEDNETLKATLLKELEKELACDKPYSLCAQSICQQVIQSKK